MKEKARSMRQNGESIKIIASQLNKSPSTIHNWVKDIILDPTTQQQLNKRGRNKANKKSHEEKIDRTNKLGWKKQTAIVDSNYDPKGIGDKSVAQIMASLALAEKKILIPFGDNDPYDLVVDENSDFIRIQCKTARFYGDHFEFKTCSNNWNSGKVTSYFGTADVFAVYLRENKQVYIFKVGNCPKTICRVRLIPYKSYSSRMADDYLFDQEKSLRDYN